MRQQQKITGIYKKPLTIALDGKQYNSNQTYIISNLLRLLKRVNALPQTFNGKTNLEPGR